MDGGAKPKPFDGNALAVGVGALSSLVAEVGSFGVVQQTQLVLFSSFGTKQV